MSERPSPLRLEYRNDLVDRVAWVELGDAGITIARERAQPRLVPYADIAVVRLRYAPMRGLPALFICTIEPRSGAPIKFGSLSYESWASGHRRVAYRALVQELHARLLRAGLRAVFMAGDTTGSFALRIAGMIVMVCMMIGLVATDPRFPNWMLAPMALGIGGLVWTQVRYFRRNEPRRYDPHAIPETLLPKDEP